MTDARHILSVTPPVKATGPLGLCNSCCAARKQDPEQPLREAVTLVPAQVPIPGPGGALIGVGVVALPQCWEHVPGPAAAGSGLLIANGEVPRR